MGFWIYMLVISLLIPVIMLMAGCFMVKCPPRRINAIIGYRTNRSMQNMETWRFAHGVAGKFWMKWGAIALLPSGVVMVLFRGQSQDTLACVGLGLTVLQFIPLLAVAPVTERALDRTFDENGRRKTEQQEE